MGFDFDSIVDRSEYFSVKYGALMFGKPEGTLPMWVADMDFRTAPCIIDAMKAASEHGIYGYSGRGDSYFEAVKGWFSRRFQWNVEREWLINTPGVVTAVNIAVRALTEPGDSVIIQQPVYYPFEGVIRQSDRMLIVSELVYENGRYSIDFDDFEAKIRDNNVKLFILCSPHNPVGRVWTRDELIQMGDICLRYGVKIVSDEIHQDFVYEGYRHNVFAGIDPEYAEVTVTCTAPSKTFNMAGLQHSNIFIKNAEIRERFMKEYSLCGLSPGPGFMGLVACKAAYADGDSWLDALIKYLSGNLKYIREYLAAQIPEIRLIEPEGTYLAWLDCRGLGIDDKKLDELLTNKAKIWLDEGPMFGAGGSGFQRLNFACPRSIVEEAMERLCLLR